MALEKKYTELRKLIVGSNDLMTWCREHGKQGEDLIAEWDEKRNGSMTLYKPGSGKVVYWKCSICNTVYTKAIKIRVNGNIHEPCGRKLGRENLIQYHKDVIKFEDSLVGRNSDLLAEWDYGRNNKEGIFPEYITFKSGQKVHWICSKCGNTYERRVRERTMLGYGCKECRKRERKEKGTCLKIIY